MPTGLGWSWGGRRFFVSEAPLYRQLPNCRSLSSVKVTPRLVRRDSGTERGLQLMGKARNLSDTGERTGEAVLEVDGCVPRT